MYRQVLTEIHRMQESSSALQQSTISLGLAYCGYDSAEPRWGDAPLTIDEHIRVRSSSELVTNLEGSAHRPIRPQNLRSVSSFTRVPLTIHLSDRNWCRQQNCGLSNDRAAIVINVRYSALHKIAAPQSGPLTASKRLQRCSTLHGPTDCATPMQSCRLSAAQ